MKVGQYAWREAYGAIFTTPGASAVVLTSCNTVPALIEVGRGAFRKAKVAMSRPDNTEKLESALAELRRIVEAQHGAEQKVKRQASAWTNAISKAQSASGKAWTAIESGEGDIYSALREWAVAQIALEKGREVSVNLQRAQYSDDPMQVLAVNPKARAILQCVCELRLAEAKERRAVALAQEQERLGPEYDANDSPIVKKQAVRVDVLETRLRRITSNESLEQVWIAF